MSIIWRIAGSPPGQTITADEAARIILEKLMDGYRLEDHSDANGRSCASGADYHVSLFSMIPKMRRVAIFGIRVDNPNAQTIPWLAP